MAEEPFSCKKVHDNVYMCRENFYDSPNVANIWLVQGSTADLVIDTGIGLWDLPGFLKQHGLIGDKPLTAVATHIHFDHSGGLHQFENFAIHSLEATAIRDGNNYETVSIFTSCLAEITVPPYDGWSTRDYRVKSAKPTRVLEEGDVFDLGDRKLRVLHFPGHTHGSIGLIDEEARILFTGDTMYNHSCIIDWLPHSNITAYKQTCRRLQELSSQVDHVFPGHMDPFDGKRLQLLATDYISKAGVCHKISSTMLRGITTMVLKAKYSGNVAAKCCYHACCCCCCLV